MLPLIVALFWVAIIAPWAVVKYRNSRSERSIDSFQAEHEVLSRQEYSVAPARRLDDAYLYEEHSYEPEHESARSRPRLTVVQDDDTYSTLENRLTWDEWERDYDYDQPHTLSTSSDHSHHRYAAYASAPSPRTTLARPAPYEPGRGVDTPLAVSMRVRRSRIFVSLGIGALLSTALTFLIGLSLLEYVAVLSWACVVLYVAAALFSISQGYLEASSLVTIGRPTSRPRTFEDADDPVEDEETYYEDEAYAGEAPDGLWRRETRRYALG